MYPPTPPQYIPGTPEYEARVAEQEQQRRDLEREQQEREDRRQAEIEAKEAAALAEIERRKEAFRAGAASFGDMETALSSHASLLHGMFMTALGEYAACAEEEKARVYGGIALRAQHYCRMTLTTMAKVKQAAIHSTEARKKIKIEDPAIKEEAHEALDSGGTPQTVGIDPQLAAMEGGNAQNGQSESGQPQECV